MPKHALQSLSIFQLVSPPTLKAIEAASVTRSWEKGASIFREGHVCEGLHVLTEGTAKLYRAGRNGREQIVLIQGAGNALAVTPLIDREPYPVSARTLTRARTLFLPKDRFDELYSRHVDFVKAILAEVSLRHRLTLTLLGTISLKPVLARVATLLLQTGALAAPDALEFRMSATQEQLANELATTREGIARSLSELRREGVIEQRGGRIRVVDMGRLRHYSED